MRSSDLGYLQGPGTRERSSGALCSPGPTCSPGSTSTSLPSSFRRICIPAVVSPSKQYYSLSSRVSEVRLSRARAVVLRWKPHILRLLVLPEIGPWVQGCAVWVWVASKRVWIELIPLTSYFFKLCLFWGRSAFLVCHASCTAGKHFVFMNMY